MDEKANIPCLADARDNRSPEQIRQQETISKANFNSALEMAEWATDEKGVNVEVCLAGRTYLFGKIVGFSWGDIKLLIDGNETIVPLVNVYYIKKLNGEDNRQEEYTEGD